jgi:hypothetical protein
VSLVESAPLRATWHSVRLTDLTLSCAAGLACRSRSGAPVAAIKLKQRDATCNRCDATALAAAGSSAAGPKPGRTSFSVKLGGKPRQPSSNIAAGRPIHHLSLNRKRRYTYVTMGNDNVQTLSEADIVIERDLVKPSGPSADEHSDNLKLLGEVPSVDRPDPNCDVND